jgi:hypothetical protein
MDPLPTPVTPPSTDAASPLASLLARLRDEDVRKGKRTTGGCTGKGRRDNGVKLRKRERHEAVRMARIRKGET